MAQHLGCVTGSDQRKAPESSHAQALGAIRFAPDPATLPINANPAKPRDSILYLYPDDVVEYHRQVRKNGGVAQLASSWVRSTRNLSTNVD